MEFKERISEIRTQVQQTILITALIAAKIIAGGIAICGLSHLPKNIQASYEAVMAITKVPLPELDEFAEDIVKGWNKENWQAEADALLSINAEVKQADKAMETLDFDKAYEHLENARKKWAAAIKKFGRSKDTTKILDMIINLKQRNRTAKVLYFADIKVNELSQEINKIEGRITTIRGKEDAAGQIARLQEIQEEILSIRRDMFKLSKQEQDRDLLGLIDQIFADCTAAIAQLKIV